MQLKLNTILITILSALSLAACNDSNDHETVTTQPEESPLLTDCMWQNSFNSKSGTGEDPLNIAFPDTHVNYWSSEFVVPKGAKVSIDGDYPYARHFSLVSYTSEGLRVNSLLDTAIEPNAGSVNPFVWKNNRLGKERAYSAQLKLDDLPTNPEKNTLYTPKTLDNKVALLYRVYVPNKNMNEKGNVSFPRFKVELENGEIKKGQAACDALQAKQTPIQKTTTISLEASLSLFNQQLYDGFPAQKEPTWYKAFSGVDNIKCIYKFDPISKKPISQCEGQPVTPKLNYWATPDNEYVFAMTSRRLGKVIELKGKVPLTPKTYDNNPFAESYQTRYWSMCTNELITTATNACIYDEQIKKVDRDGLYTIISSLPEDRPVNATEECGVHFLPLSPRGSGYVAEDGKAAGHPDLGIFIMRNLLPEPDFYPVVQNVKAWGTEKEIMGDHLPSIKYTSKEDFEAKGCL